MPTLLQYSITTDPVPLQTGISGHITLHISPPADAVLCKQIIVNINYGPGSGNIFIDKPTVGNLTPANSGWKLSTPIVKGDVTTQTVTLNNNTPSHSVTEPIRFILTGNVNTTPTTGQLDIIENSSLGNTKPTFTKKTMPLPVPSTTTPPLAITSFIAHSVASPTIPATDFTNGEAFTLSWNGNSATSYQLFQSNMATPIYTGPNTTFPVKGIGRDTTFVLIATDNSAGKSNTVAKSLTITVSNPTLTSATVTSLAAGSTAVTKATVNEMTVGGLATFKGPLNVTGAATMASATITNLTATGPATFNGPLAAAGPATVTGLSTLNGGLTANGTTTIGGPATLNEGLTVKGKLTVNGPVSTPLKHQVICKLSASVKPFALTAQSDGFFIFQMDGLLKPLNFASRFYVSVQYPGDSAPLTFNVLCNAGQGYISQTIPVCAGTTLSCAPTWFHVSGAVYWIGATAPTPTAAKSLENTKLPTEVAAFQKQVEDLKTAASRKEAYARSFIEELQVQFNKELSPEAQDLLTTKLLNVERGL